MASIIINSVLGVFIASLGLLSLRKGYHPHQNPKVAYAQWISIQTLKILFGFAVICFGMLRNIGLQEAQIRLVEMILVGIISVNTIIVLLTGLAKPK